VACELELLDGRSLATENTHYKYAWMDENTQQAGTVNSETGENYED
jgi:hypothetical protein